MPATVKIIRRHDKEKADGTAPLYLRVTINRKTRQLSTGIYVRSADWNPKKQRVRSGHDLSEAYNAKLLIERNRALQIGLEAPTSGAVARALRTGSGAVLASLDQFLVQLARQDKHWEVKHYKVLRGKLAACFDPGVSWKELDSGALVRFEEHLRRRDGNADNTIRNHLKRLRRLYRRELQMGTVSADRDPFRGYTPPRATQVRKRRLTRKEVVAIEELGYPWGTSLRHARDAFLFAFYGSGVRFGDICVLTPQNLVEGQLVYRMMKTRQPVNQKLPEVAIRLIRPYVEEEGLYLFPFLGAVDASDAVAVRRRISSRNVVINRNLKRIATDCGIEAEGLTFHVARHSFADQARRLSGNLHAISKALGHQDLKTTQHYLADFDQDAADELVDLVFGVEEEAV